MSFSMHSQTHDVVWGFGFCIGGYGPGAILVGIDTGFGCHACWRGIGYRFDLELELEFEDDDDSPGDRDRGAM